MDDPRYFASDEPKYFADKEVPKIDPNSAYGQRMASLYSMSLKADPALVLNIMGAGDKESLDWAMIQNEISDAQVQMNGVIDIGSQEDLGPDELSDEYAKNITRSSTAAATGPALAYLGDVLGDRDLTAQQAKRVRNAAIIREMVDAKVAEYDNDGIVSSSLQFVENLGYAITVGWMESILGFPGDNVEAYQSLFDEDDPVVLRQKLTTLLKEGEDKGFFSDENYYFLLEKADQITAAGFSPETTQARVFDILFLGASPGLTNLVRKAGSNILRTATGAAIPAASAVTAASVQHQSTNIFSDLMKINHGALVRDPAAVNARAAEMAQELAKKSSMSYRNLNVKVDDLENYTMEVTLGKPNGVTLFETEESARKVADMVGGKVLEGPEGFQVKVTQRIPISGLNPMTDATDLEQGFIRNVFGSANITSSKPLNDLYKMTEATIGTVKRQIWNPYTKFFKTVPVEDQQGVNRVIQRILNEDTHRNSWYTSAEFDNVYRSITGNAPSPKAKELYERLVDMDMASYRIQADGIMKKKVEGGYTDMYTFNNGPEVLAKSFSGQAGPRDLYFDYLSGRAKKFSTNTGDRVFQLDEAIEIDGVYYKFVAGPVTSKRIVQHSDVLGFKPGGPRVYDNARWFVKQDQTINAAGKGFVKGKPRAVFGAFSQKVAEKGMMEFNAIVDAINTGSPLRTVNRIIRENNGWNPTIENLEDFNKFIKDEGLTLDRVSRVFDGEPVDPNLAPILSGGVESWGDVFKGRGSFVSARKDKPLMNYGEPALQTVDPTLGITQRFSRAVTALNERAYMQRSLEGFFKGVEKLKAEGKNVVTEDNANLGDKFQRLQAMKISRASPEGRKFSNEQATILRRGGQITYTQKLWRQMAGSVAEFVFDKTGKVTPKSFLSSDPIEALRGFAFFTRLGFFALPQLFTQASQTAMAVAISPKYGLQGSLLYPVIRMAMDNGQKQVLKALSDRAVAGLAKVSPLDPVEFENFIKHYRASGRYEVTHTIVELDGSNSMFLSSEKSELKRHAGNIWRGLKEKGRTPYVEGERVARTVADWVAFKEFREKFPTQDFMGQRAQEWIAGRADNLTGNMTGASKRRFLQEGPASIPMQFLSYHLSMTEQLFTNRILTKGERSRVALAQLFLYGSAGVPGASWLYDELSDPDDPMDPDVYAAIHGGVVDYLLTQLDEEVTYSKRLGFGQGYVDIWKKMSQGEFAEVIGGPSGQLATETVMPAFNMIKDIVAGRPAIVEYDLEKMLRITAVGDSAFKAWYSMRYGEYVSKTGKVLSDNAQSPLALAFGFKPLEVAVREDYNEQNFNNSKMVDKLGTRVSELSRVFRRQLEAGDTETAFEVQQNIINLISGANLSPMEETQLYSKFLTPQLESYQMMKAAVDLDRRRVTQLLATLQNKGNQN